MGLLDWFKSRKSTGRVINDLVQSCIQKYGETIGAPIGLYIISSASLLMPDRPFQILVSYQKAALRLMEMFTKSNLYHSETFPEIRNTLIPILIVDMGSLLRDRYYNVFESSNDYRQHAVDINLKTLIEMLKYLTGQDFGRDKDKWQKWWDENKHLNI